MTYKRKTVDEWVVQGNYGKGWEDVTTEETYKEIRQRLKEYRENESYPFRIKLKRIKGTPIPESVSTCQVLKTHDDGDLTLQCKDAKYVVTTEGQTFKEVKK